jgi:demethylmenaquinone methyltransferase/2-methoxy-6-polyprenyl-1,4-benzoquinol methylase
MDLFDWIAPLYDRIFHFSDPAKLLTLLAMAPHHRLLDVGGGTGRVTNSLTGFVEHACVVDVSWGMLVEARAKGLCAYQSIAERLPFPDQAFDRILIVDAFHHFQDWPRATTELLRVLRPGGRIVIEEPDIRNGPVKLIALAERLLLMRSRFYAPADLAHLFQSAGGRVTLYEDQTGIYWAVVEHSQDKTIHRPRFNNL